MAITKTLAIAIPYNKDSKVEQWELTMKYEQGDKTLNEETGEYTYAANYYTSSFPILVPATNDQGNVNFTPKAEGSWTLAELTALCPISKWDSVFTIQYDSVITNPSDDFLPKPDFVIPS